MWYDDKVNSILDTTDDRGILQSREGATLEFKESFSFSDINDYAKTMAAFANNRGGIFVFGVADSPRRILGIKRDKFESIDVAKINDHIMSSFSPSINWGMSQVEREGKFIGVIYVNEAIDKPLICRRNSDKTLKHGAIYYRYRGQNRVIEYAELKMIHDEIREKERKRWMAHIQKIARIGIENVELIDLFKGEIETGDTRFVLDEALLRKMRGSLHFVESGRFVENDGEPTLKIVGEIEPTASIPVAVGNPDKTHPYFTNDLKDILGINRHQITLLIWKCQLKGNPRYHFEMVTSKKSSSKANKYSIYALERLKKELAVLMDKAAWSDLKYEYDAVKRKLRDD